MGRFESIGVIQPFLKLQEGDWADVYKAYDTSLERNVLLKRLKSEYENDVDIAHRFEEEARLMARIEHPNVVRVLSSGRSGRTVYFIAEFVEGVSLEVLLGSGNLPSYLAAYILREVAEGLLSAHKEGIFHRDIKPANILISVDGEVKLTDFGLASLMDAREESELRGTLGYLAPELLFEGEPGIESDMFSMGATFYEMLTGQSAFRGESSSEIIDRILHHDPTPIVAANPHVLPDLIQVCRTLLNKTPTNRYSNCEQLLQKLNAFLNKTSTLNGAKSLAQFVADPGNYIPDALVLSQIKSASTKNQHKQIDSPEPDKASPLLWGSVTFLVLVFATTLIAMNLRSKELPVHQASAVPVEDTVAVLLAKPEPTVVDADSVIVQPVDAEVIPPSSLPESIEILAASADNSEHPDAEVLDTLQIQPAEVVMGALNVLCTPYCIVYIDGDSVGSAPPVHNQRLTVGVHQLELVHPLLPAYKTDVVVEAASSKDVKVALLDDVGMIELNVIPYAKVYIDSVFKGPVPPVTSFILSPGKHTLELVHDELGVLRDTLLVAPGEKQSHSYNLKISARQSSN